MESSINDLTYQLKTQESTFEKRFNKQKEELGKAVYELEKYGTFYDFHNFFRSVFTLFSYRIQL